MSSGLKNILMPYTEMPFNQFSRLKTDSIDFSMFKPRLFLGLIPPQLQNNNLYFSIPNFLENVPLNFIYKRLDNEESELGKQEIFFIWPYL